MGQTLKELNLLFRYRANLIAIRRTTESADTAEQQTTDQLISVPGPDEHIEATDVLLLSGSDETLSHLPGNCVNTPDIASAAMAAFSGISAIARKKPLNTAETCGIWQWVRFAAALQFFSSSSSQRNVPQPASCSPAKTVPLLNDRNSPHLQRSRC
ncbi:MAG: hypothetical protein GY758_06485 [Fuerstiella sp.]|nr:hypothetical protein [Fuerstiella sp.]MCP4505672.1 hypothetical protein [Fuerstiella sp.]